MSLSATQRGDFDQQGYVLLRGAFDAPSVQTLLAAATDLADAFDAEAPDPSIPAGPYPVVESILDAPEVPLINKLSKLFRLHRVCPSFHAFAQREEVLGWLAQLIGDDVDCFLSQFIFKLPGALGQPWHQDAFYFPYEGPPQLGLWVAVTDAALDNGPLWVIPGSHREPIHPVQADPRPHSNPGYVEISDIAPETAVPVLMQAGDALLFHSHLMHKSTDNTSVRPRAAMVYHYAHAATVDRSIERWGRVAPNTDWMPVLRNGTAVPSGVGRDA